MLVPEIDSRLAFWSTTFMAIMVGAGKLISLWRSVRASAETEEQRREQAMWKRRDEHLDDLQADNERLRLMLKERDRECEDLRRDLERCWNEANRRRWPRMTPPEDTPRVTPPKRGSRS